MKKYLGLILGVCSTICLSAQPPDAWTEKDRTYLADNLRRSIDQINEATRNLSDAQWNFKPGPDKWSINQVVEHIAIWELLLQRDISLALSDSLKPELGKTAWPDSSTLGFIMEEKPHHSLDYTKPFSFTIPMGLNQGTKNLLWLQKLRKEDGEFVNSTKQDLRAYYRGRGSESVHVLYILIFGHADRHLRQIMKIKADPAFPSS
ncbi:MAG TPA: DinB family protein [Flavitalea sp.]|nr:DinB family protein [Flavitalea sp.]